MKMLRVICTLFIFGFVSVSHASVIFITEKDANGVTSLLGADNVEVNGLYYNVRFLDGSCIALFNGCDDPADFFFGYVGDALDASISLLDQVFIRGTGFDIAPELINGCSNGRSGCNIFTPYAYVNGFSFCHLGAQSAGCHSRDVIEITMFLPGSERAVVNSDFLYYTYAVWSKPVEASAPGTAMLLLMGIAGLIVSQRRKQA
jgi:hypothetical protein